MKNKGSITILVLVFGGIFLVLATGLLGYASLQLRQSGERAAWNEALHVAEAGIDYFKWCLNNNSEDLCPVEKDYYDASGKLVGRFSLSVNSVVSCGETIQRTITSTGWTYRYPDVKRKISALYGRTSVAKYSYILDDNVWVGPDHEIRGPYHSNGGIRMDGENQSIVTSGQSNWVCTSSFGCSSCPVSAGCFVQNFNCVCPGVFTTANGSEDLFQYPMVPFSFENITINLGDIKTSAINFGVYLPPSATLDPDGKGYHLVFLNNGTFEVWIITDLSDVWAYSLEEDWHSDNFVIADEYLYNTYSFPPACSVVFVEDNLWPEGEILGKVTVASANLIDSNTDTDTVLLGEINYTTLDGSDGLALISERNILIGPQSPDQMEIRGIFVAQKGRFARNHYPDNFRSKLEIYGSIVSNGRVGTKWTSGSQVISGYTQRESYFDSNLIYAAPPFVPAVDPDLEIVNWEELSD